MPENVERYSLAYLPSETKHIFRVENPATAVNVESHVPRLSQFQLWCVDYDIKHIFPHWYPLFYDDVMHICWPCFITHTVMDGDVNTGFCSGDWGMLPTSV